MHKKVVISMFPHEWEVMQENGNLHHYLSSSVGNGVSRIAKEELTIPDAVLNRRVSIMLPHLPNTEVIIDYALLNYERMKELYLFLCAGTPAPFGHTILPQGRKEVAAFIFKGGPLERLMDIDSANRVFEYVEKRGVDLQTAVERTHPYFIS